MRYRAVAKVPNYNYSYKIQKNLSTFFLISWQLKLDIFIQRLSGSMFFYSAAALPGITFHIFNRATESILIRGQ